MAYRKRYFEGEVTSPAIVSGAVTEEKIADDAITSRKIKDETITGADIGAGQVQTEDLADGAVTARKLGSDVSIVPLADNAVSTAKIQDNAVVTQKINNQAVTSDKLQDAGVSSIKIANGAVTTAKIATSAVTKAKLASNSVGYLEIINGSVEPRHIRAIDTPANGEVPSYNQLHERFEWVAPGGGVSRPLTPPVATGEIADGAVTSPKLSYKVVSVTVPIGAIGRTEPPAGDPDLVGGVILGYSIPINADQIIRQLVLLPNGAVSITLVAAVIVDNTFDVVVLRQ